MTQAIRLWLMGLFLLGMPIVHVSNAAAQNDERAPQVVTGTLMKLDMTGMKGLLKTDLGKPIFFNVTKLHLFERLSVGQRVTVELDSYGRANKVIDASVTEFLSPMPEEPGSQPIQPVG